MFFRHYNCGKKAILIVYVDNIIFTGDDCDEISRLKEYLAIEFEIKDLGPLKYFLGMEVARSGKGGIFVTQRKCTNDLLLRQTVNPIILEDQTINEVVEEPYNEDDRSIPEYNPHSEYGLDDFNEDYIRHSGSREGVNDELAHDHGMGSDPTDGGGCTWFLLVQVEINFKMMALMLPICPEMQFPDLGLFLEL
ncbi:hypothetical protein LWI29_013364 [Acer saccharum]|uniref:Reverse transcriptase Ty1/copia-type domain-containing protein n=1 Tax=Acer saccharum TaxID=4024 RepID=A0AA39W2T2_ACESA|nr:hypothetical protein LWI29_013364 [Acer saccharum]